MWLKDAEPFVPLTLQIPNAELLTANTSHNSPSVFNDDAPLFEPNGQASLDFEFPDCNIQDGYSPMPDEETSSNFRLKEKTEICKNWLSNTCRFGDRCAFAHGYDEVQLKSHVAPRYKVTKCRSYHTDNVCMYGQRCQFAHFIRTKFTNYEQVFKENARQMSIRITGVVNPDLTQFNVVQPNKARLQAFKEVCGDVQTMANTIVAETNRAKRSRRAKKGRKF